MKTKLSSQPLRRGSLPEPIRTKNFGKAEIDGVFNGEQPIVQFYWGGMGIAPSSREFGFYYAPDDEPVKFQNEQDGGILYSEENGEWRFSDSGGNTGKMIRILPNWFYYDIVY